MIYFWLGLVHTYNIDTNSILCLDIGCSIQRKKGKMEKLKDCSLGPFAPQVRIQDSEGGFRTGI